MSLQRIFEDKIKLGPAQYVPVFFLSLIQLNDGAQLVLSSFLNPIIKQQWNLQDRQVQYLASVFYIGVFLGSILSGKFSDAYGRKPIITLGSLMQIIVSTIFFWVNDYSIMLMARGIYGFSYGFTAVIVTSMVAEIMPMKYRGKSIVFENFCGSIGKMYGVLLGAIFLTSFTSGNWRAMMLMSSLPNVFVLIWALISLHQSPRYLIATNQLQKAYFILDKMIQKNSSSTSQANYLTQEDKQQLKTYYDQTFSHITESSKIRDLFSTSYWRITLCLCFAWLFVNSSYFGQLVILPFIFGENHKNLSSYALTVAGEVPCILISLFFIDRPHFGRKNTLIIFFLISSVFHIVFGLNTIVIFSSLCRLSMKMCFQMLYACSTQLYGTLVRALGFGFTSAIGRLGAAIIPFIIIPLLNEGILIISLIFCLFTALGALSTYLLPFEPMKYGLDEKKQLNQNENLHKQQIPESQMEDGDNFDMKNTMKVKQ